MNSQILSSADRPHLAAREIALCPVCGGTELKTKLRYGRKFLRKCLRCGVFFVIPQPSPATLASHFEAGGLVMGDKFDVQFEVNRRPVLNRVANCIRSRKNTGSILDVGCATGSFLAGLTPSSGWDAWGVELSLPAAQEARRRGIHVHVGDTRSARFKDRSFDAITVLDAFYYFPNPRSELAELGRILKQDGLLALELPWANTRLWQRAAIIGRLINGSHVPLLKSSDHIFYYTPKSVTALLEQCGFRVQAIRPLPANRQRGLVRDFLWKTYGFISRLLWALSAGIVFLGPRFLVVAGKAPHAVPEKEASSPISDGLPESEDRG